MTRIEGRSQNDTKLTCVVLDANVWVYKTKLLRSPLGHAFLYALRQVKARIGLPDVLEMEIKKHAHRLANEAVTGIDEGLFELERLLGHRPSVSIPTGGEIITAINGRLTELDPFLERIPMSLEHAK